MRLNEKQFNNILKTIRSDNSIRIMNLLSSDRGYTFGELKDMMEYKKKSESGKFAYYIRRLVSSGIIKQDGKFYLLTRIGLQTVHLLEDFKEICMSFDLSDCDADGKVQMVVIRK